MSKLALFTGSLGLLIATSAFAQTDPATDPEHDASPTMTQEAPAADPAMPADAAETESDREVNGVTGDVDPMAEHEPAPVDVSTLTGEQLIGADILSADGETIASVEDVVLTGDGQVEQVIAQFGGVLGFGSSEVALTLDELQFMQDQSGSIVVETSLTPEELEGRPEHEEPETDSAG